MEFLRIATHLLLAGSMNLNYTDESNNDGEDPEDDGNDLIDIQRLTTILG